VAASSDPGTDPCRQRRAEPPEYHHASGAHFHSVLSTEPLKVLALFCQAGRLLEQGSASVEGNVMSGLVFSFPLGLSLGLHEGGFAHR